MAKADDDFTKKSHQLYLYEIVSVFSILLLLALFLYFALLEKEPLSSPHSTHKIASGPDCLPIDSAKSRSIKNRKKGQTAKKSKSCRKKNASILQPQ